MIDAFRAKYGGAEGVRVYRAPGRVNLIGEHTDYNLGFVLPVALHLATYIASAPAQDGQLHIYSEDRSEMQSFRVAEIAELSPAGHWSDYPAAVARELVRAGFAVAPSNLLIRSTVPEGAGLSSSAALEVAAALALLNGRVMAPLELARLCQRAEREFVGLPCGIMDQFISVHGHKDSAVELDCRSLEYRTVELPRDVTFIAVNTMVKHALAGSAYKERVRECAEAAEGLGVESLRDASLELLEIHRTQLSGVAARRARHVITENQRVHQFVKASAAGEVIAMGKLMVESHRSLRDDYEVSCAELDFLVDAALAIEGVFGSRMTGGGFGGCTVTMLRPDAAARFKDAITRTYLARFGVTPAVYPCHPSDGAAEVKNFETIPAATVLVNKST